jgi:hypothetical protein
MESNSTDEKKSKNKNNNAIKEEFKYEFSEDLENDDEYEKTLERDIETNCDLTVYVNKLEIEEKSDFELLKLDKEEIIDFKNYQIQKLKAYIFSLEKEKEDLIENFKNTTNVLIDKIKEQEFRDSGIRPETPFIAKKLKTGNLQNEKKNNSRFDKNSSTSSMTNQYNTGNKNFFGDEEESKFTGEINLKTGLQRCPHCTKEFPQEYFLQHSLDCLRNKIRCKKCNELIDEKFKKEHLLEYRSKEVCIGRI